MKTYQYKIQWLFPVKTSFFITEKQSMQELNQIIKILGSVNLTIIQFRRGDYSIIKKESYRIAGTTDKYYTHKAIMKCLKEKIKNNPDIYYVELIRK